MVDKIKSVCKENYSMRIIRSGQVNKKGQDGAKRWGRTTNTMLTGHKALLVRHAQRLYLNDDLTPTCICVCVCVCVCVFT